MLKMYHQHAESGASAAYWEQFGRHGTLADRVKFLDVDPLRPLFQRFLKPRALMLEGGCGRGQYVAYYTARGAKVIGLDFARDWLAKIHAEAPQLKLCTGDVATLPFRDGTFDLYYSGGVVEHFEAGADRALSEARRVLKPDGILLISVPYLSPLRKVLRLVRRDDWRNVSGPSLDGDVMPGRQFYQYAYTVLEFERYLASAGFRVLETQGYAILWGLYDVAALRSIARRFERRAPKGPAEGGHERRKAADEDNAVSGFRQRVGPSWKSFFKRLIVAEDATVPAAGWLVKTGRWLCANMMMFICMPAVDWGGV